MTKDRPLIPVCATWLTVILAKSENTVWKTEKVNWHKTFDSRFDSKIVSIIFLNSEVFTERKNILEK